MQDLARAIAEDRAGQEVLRAAEEAKRVKIIRESRRIENGMAVVERVVEMDVPLKFIQFSFTVCATEDEHDFNSMGQCSKCGSHRKPR